jgi:hypothetical protein
VISENSDCALCLKLENQNHAIANQLNLVEQKDLSDDKTVLITVRWSLAQKRHFQARAPPHIS